MIDGLRAPLNKQGDSLLNNHSQPVDRRGVDYLRLSLTDRCNLNCSYCTPLEKSRFLSREEVLRYEEIFKLVSLFVKIGVRRLRITGGEPLIKKDIARLIKMLKGIDTLEEVSMTTNGVYLEDFACCLKEAGLDRLNISIDTLKKERFEAITGYDRFKQVWSGIKEALKVNFYPIKLNVVIMKGINDDEILDFARLTFDYPLIIRFIEFFPVNKRSLRLSEHLLTSDSVKEKITAHIGALQKISAVSGNGPAEYYKIKATDSIVGFISSYSADFCEKCNRIRMDCAGRIFPCLFSNYTHDTRRLLRNEKNDSVLLDYLKGALKIKPEYRKNKTGFTHSIEMSSIGG